MFPTTYAHHVQLLCCSVAHKHHRMFLFISYNTMSHTTKFVTGQLICDGTRVENRFRLLAKRTSPFKSAGVSAQSTTGSQGVRISVSNDGYTMFRGSVKCTGYPLHSPVSLSFPLLCVTLYHHISTGVYHHCCPIHHYQSTQCWGHGKNYHWQWRRRCSIPSASCLLFYCAPSLSALSASSKSLSQAKVITARLSVNRMARKTEGNINQYKWRRKYNRSREIWRWQSVRILSESWQ